MVVSEKGCLATCSAVKKKLTPRQREIEAVLYRESYSGGVAAAFPNNRDMFGANLFKLVPKREFTSMNRKEDHRSFKKYIALNWDSPTRTIFAFICEDKNSSFYRV